MDQLGPNALGEVLEPGRVTDCYLGLLLPPPPAGLDGLQAVSQTPAVVARDVARNGLGTLAVHPWWLDTITAEQTMLTLGDGAERTARGNGHGQIGHPGCFAAGRPRESAPQIGTF